MPKILSVGTFDPPYVLEQSLAAIFVRERFQSGFADVERMMSVFDNSRIDQRHMSVPLEWFLTEHSLKERNDLYIERATEYSIGAIEACLTKESFLAELVPVQEIDVIIFISTTGMATPSIEARIMNRLPFSPHTKRIPIWGLGCAGGVSGIARAREYCLADPDAKVLVVAIELCSLTYQHDDFSKSNLVGAALFADGVACVLVTGDRVQAKSKLPALPQIRGHQTTLMPNSERVMGWDVKDRGLYVVFSRDIPDIIRGWLKENVDEFLEAQRLNGHKIEHFIAHPGGRKVLEAYQEALGLTEDDTAIAREVLRLHGNMSSPSILYVLKEFMQKPLLRGERGLMTSLGPGFTSELLLLEWM